MLLTVTDAGSIVETNALNNGTFPAVDKILVGDGVPPANPSAATALVHQVLALNVTIVERVNPQTVRFHAEIPQGIEINIRELGIQLADGTLYAYAPFTSSLASYFHKPAGFAFSFSVMVARTALPVVTVNYAPLDTGVIAADIASQTLAQIGDYNGRIMAIEATSTTLATAQTALQTSMSALQGYVDDSTDSLNTRVSAMEALVYAAL